MNKILVCLALLLPGLSLAATLTWNAAAMLPAPAIGGYNVYFANSDAALSALPNTIPGPTNPNPTTNASPWVKSVGNVLTWTTPTLAPGTYFYAVTTWWCPQNGNACQESAQSSHVSVTIGPSVSTPNAPTGVKISASVSVTSP